MTVTVDGKPIPFSRTPAPMSKKPTWRINGKYLVLSYDTIPAAGAVKVRYAGVKQALDRHDPAKATGSPGDFARYAVTIQGETRHGLLLVAPTTAEWDVTLPPKAATFETWLTLEAPPIHQPASDGAAIELRVVADGQEHLVAEFPLIPGAAPLDANGSPSTSSHFTDWKVDLSEWAGKPVTLRLDTKPGKTPVFDWVFAGSPTVFGPPDTDVRRVVVIAMDTTRPDHLSLNGYQRPTTPEIDAFAKSGVVFSHTWSTAPRTRPSFRSSTTGRLPLDAVGATNIADVFEHHGFATAGFVANVHLQPRFAFDEGYDSWLFDGKANAEQQVDRAIGWLQSNSDVDGYLFVHFMDPHMVYDAPEPYGTEFVGETDPNLPDKVKREQVVAMMHKGTLSDVAKQELVAEHDGELAYMSAQMKRLFDAVDALPGRTLIVLHSDHGEEFWEHGGFEHNHSLYDEVTRTVFVLRPGKGLPAGRSVDAPVTLMDLAPTLYDLFGFPEIPQVDGHSLVPLLAGAQTFPARPLPVGYLQYAHERWGVIWKDHKYILHTGTGREELYDLSTDPQETQDLAANEDLSVYRQKLHEAHGVPVGPGFRVKVDLAPNGPPLVLQLPAPADQAGVLDPESIVENRANIEWGEIPKKLSFEVGQVTLSDDKKTVTFQPGVAPDGILYVLFHDPQDADAVKATLGGTDIALGAEKAVKGQRASKGRVWKEGAFSVAVDPGTVVIPPPTEADRMGIGVHSAGDQNDFEMLCKLGYVSQGCPGEDAAPPEPRDEEELGTDPGDG
jgi:arylsulfatase A-like enzyme